MSFFNAFFSPTAEPAAAAKQLAAARAELDRLLAAREGVLIEGDDAALDAHDGQIAAARRQVERCGALVTRGEREAEDMAQREEEARLAAIEAERWKRYDAARDQAEALMKEVPALYGQVLVQARTVLRRIAEATIAVEAANADLPPAAPRLADPESALRVKGSLPRRELSTETVSLYVNAYGQPVPDSLQAQVRRSEDGSFHLRGQHGEIHPVSVARFNKTTFLPARRVDMPLPLARELHLPALLSGAVAPWSAREHLSHPASVLQYLDTTESACRLTPPSEGDQRRPEVELTPVPVEISPSAAAEHAPSRSRFVPMGRATAP